MEKIQYKRFFSRAICQTLQVFRKRIHPSGSESCPLERGLVWLVDIAASSISCRRSDWRKCYCWTSQFEGENPRWLQGPRCPNPLCFFKEAKSLPWPIMESFKHNLSMCIRTSHTTTHLPFLSLAHNNRFCVWISEHLLCACCLGQGLWARLCNRGRRPRPSAGSAACCPVLPSTCPCLLQPFLPTACDEWGRLA